MVQCCEYMGAASMSVNKFMGSVPDGVWTCGITISGAGGIVGVVAVGDMDEEAGDKIGGGRLD